MVLIMQCWHEGLGTREPVVVVYAFVASPSYHTFINFLSHTHLLLYLPYLQSTNILRTIILLILTLSLFPPTNLLHAQTLPRSHPTYKKIKKLIIAPAVHATFFCHHLKKSRRYRPENLWINILFRRIQPAFLSYLAHALCTDKRFQ